MPDSFEIGRHEAQIAALDARVCRMAGYVESIDEKLDQVIISLAEKRGERKAVVWIAGFAGTIASLIITVLARMWHS